MGFLGFGAEELGEVPVPGEGRVALPAGKVKIRYVEDRSGRSVQASANNRWSGPAEDLVVTVTSASGEAVPVEPQGGIKQGMGRTLHREHGSIELPSEGEYVVSAQMTIDPESHENPRIVLRA